MSHQKVRKVAGAESHRRASLTKPSGDQPSAPCQASSAKQYHSRNKIPKSVRYDLENALVGLCDVWFEEIKPHLVRNNIKVHVHEAGCTDGDRQVLPTGASYVRTDEERLPLGAPGCSHLDPAFSSSVCELCRLLFNAANCIESAVSQAASAALTPPAPAFTTPEIVHQSTESRC